MASIKELRERKLLTQAELGELVGVSAGAVYKWENGRISRPRFSVLRRLGEVLGVDPLSIEFGGGEPARPAEGGQAGRGES